MPTIFLLPPSTLIILVKVFLCQHSCRRPENFMRTNFYAETSPTGRSGSLSKEKFTYFRINRVHRYETCVLKFLDTNTGRKSNNSYSLTDNFCWRNFITKFYLGPFGFLNLCLIFENWKQRILNLKFHRRSVTFGNDVIIIFIMLYF